MTPLHGVLLFGAAALAGALNAVAGGGSFVSFPALVFSGVPPIPANATSTVALWPGGVASAGAYRRRLPSSARLLVPLIASSLLGGWMGAVLLLHTPPATFLRLVPYLFLAATLVFAFGRRLAPSPSTSQRLLEPSGWALVGAAIAQLAIATYGGYFGGGMGILMLAVFSLLPLEDVHSMNALKTVMATAINGAAVVTFVAARAVAWPEALVMMGGAIVGGYGSARSAQRLDPRHVRGFIMAVGFGMSIYFLVRR
jgi:uncharacterized protein